MLKRNSIFSLYITFFSVLNQYARCGLCDTFCFCIRSLWNTNRMGWSFWFVRCFFQLCSWCNFVPIMSVTWVACVIDIYFLLLHIYTSFFDFFFSNFNSLPMLRYVMLFVYVCFSEWAALFQFFLVSSHIYFFWAQWSTHDFASNSHFCHKLDICSIFLVR